MSDKILNIKYALENKNEIINKINEGSIFIYPTDTIYGLGCDATNTRAVNKLRRIKKRYTKPLSIIAPNKTWILKHCYIKKKYISYLKKLPGPFTLLLKLKNKGVISSSVTNNDVVGVRIPNHKFTKIIQKTGKPFVTTSVNISGKKYAICIDEVSVSIKKHCIMIEDGVICGRPSTIIDLTGEKIRIIGR